MARLGVTQDMLDAAEEVGVALQQSMEGREATQNSLQTHQSLARSLDRDAEELYTKAKEKLTSGDEETARTFLLKRTDVQDKLKKILKLCAEEKRRVETMEQNVQTIQQRALEVEALLNRTVSAKARQESFTDFSLEREDPLLKKFRDMGID
jgi:phage shock protein A